MSGQHPHPGPGPSYYHPSPPPPHHVYGNQIPGPVSPYQYSYPPPLPHMNPNLHQNPSARPNGRGGANSYSSRGAHNYQNYHPSHQPYSHVNPLAIHAPHPQQHQHNPYSPHPKFNQPYSPSYGSPSPGMVHYPIVNSAPYSPSWQAQQTLSPLPKQLSMPPPTLPATYTEPLIAPPAQESLREDTLEEFTDPLAPLSQPSASPSLLLPSSSSYSQMGTISSSHSNEGSALPLGDNLASPTLSTSPRPSVVGLSTTIAIWSRRPHDPSQAPGIIISPRARPPPDVVQLAVDERTPPASPVIPLAKIPVVADDPQRDAKIDESIVEPATEITPKIPHSDADSPPTDTWASLTNSSVPSSTATATTNTPIVPGSPASTNTSISMVETSSKDLAREITKPSPDALTILDVPATVSETPSAITEPVSEPVVESKPTAPPPLKKSWASLLQSGSSSSSKNTSGGVRNALPTSSVVGFSIPAALTSGPPVPVSPSKKSELVTLLTTIPSGSNASTKIRPRGLVNNGNMCFANSILQVLVYCPPFQALFRELGKLLVGPVVNGENKPKAGTTPLVDATIDFLKEFVEEEQKELVNGAGGKGKEKERAREEDSSDWEGESFLPTNVYEAMKEKKRFDNMRGGHQEDAEEFLGFYLDTLEEELLSILNTISPQKDTKSAPVEEKEEAAPPEEDGWLEVGKRNRTVVTRTIKATESPITRIFGGKFRSTLRAPGQKDSVIVEEWRSLRLDIQREQIHTIQDALSYISHPQPVQVSQSTRPGVTIEASQQVLIEALPPILVLHIKRFCYDTTVGGVVKVGKQVRFGPELEVGSGTSFSLTLVSNTYKTGVDLMVATSRRPTRYKLFCALYHHGLSASGGHYTLDILHPNRYPSATPSAKLREGWVRIDDELVSDVRPEDVFGTSERDDSRCAYLLFYRRIR